MREFMFGLTLWRWNPAVVIRRVRNGSPHNNFDFSTAMKVAHTVKI